MGIRINADFFCGMFFVFNKILTIVSCYKKSQGPL